MISHERGLYVIAGGIHLHGYLKMLSIALSLYFSTIPQSRPKFTLYPLAILHQILNNSVDVYQRAILAKFSDLGNVCNKTSLSLTSCYRSLHCEGTQIHCGYFLMSSPENG